MKGMGAMARPDGATPKGQVLPRFCPNLYLPSSKPPDGEHLVYPELVPTRTKFVSCGVRTEDEGRWPHFRPHPCGVVKTRKTPSRLHPTRSGSLPPTTGARGFYTFLVYRFEARRNRVVRNEPPEKRSKSLPPANRGTRCARQDGQPRGVKLVADPSPTSILLRGGLCT